MSEHDKRAFGYRQKAEELRALLPDMTDPAARQMLEKIADGYDQMARTHDSLAKADTPAEKL